MPSKRSRYSRAHVRSTAIRRSRRRGSSRWFYATIADIKRDSLSGSDELHDRQSHCMTQGQLVKDIWIMK